MDEGDLQGQEAEGKFRPDHARGREVVIYPDASFLVALYVEETFTPQVHDYMSKLEEGVLFTPFHRLEARTALRLRIFREETSAAEGNAIFRRMDEHLLDGVLLHTPLVWGDALREAVRLGAAHVAGTGVRSGDLLHVALAMVLDAQEFLPFDQRQAKLARRAGLKVKT